MDEAPGLFDPPPEASAPRPLADRMRPRTLDEVVGQEAVAGEGGFLRGALAAGRVPSLVFWGPPGCGKTTLAEVIARETESRFLRFSAVTSGIKEVRQVMQEAARLQRASGQRTLLFVDEIHRFNRAQQDAFLPFVERGEIVLLGATTQNPSFELNAALLSRCRVVVLEPLGPEALLTLLRRALGDVERGLGAASVRPTSEALDAIVQLASGDARKALNLLELGVEDASRQGLPTLAAGRVQEIAQRKVLLYDKAGEEHFNLISALHKSLRESDPDAALYWLARMLAAGEPPTYVARRLARFASEDVGLADPGALAVALHAWEAYERLGSPEGELALAEATLYLALAPKSNRVYTAWGAVRRAVQERGAEPVPKALRNAPTALMRRQGYGAGYVYAPDTEEGVAGLDCLPRSLRSETYYRPGTAGFEAELGERLERFRRLRERARRSGPGRSGPRA